MDEIDSIQGLDILTYLRKSGVQVDDSLCTVVPDEVMRKKGKPKALCVIDKLIDDKKGVLSAQFPNYYNRFPELTQEDQVMQLKESFQRFVQQILFGKKHQPASLISTHPPEPAPDVLGEKIGTLINELRGKWTVWSIEKGYLEILTGVKTLLPLLQEKYRNPMLESDAMMIQGDVEDVIPDECINFLYDIMMTLYHIYTVKIGEIRDDLDLWKVNASLLSDIHTVAKTLLYDMAWTVFGVSQGRPQSISDLCTDIIEGINTMYFIVQENTENEEKQENPPEEK